MKLVTWNIRGLNKIYKQKELNKFLNENKVGIVAIVEHRVKHQVAVKFVNKVAVEWNWSFNYQHTGKGRIWVLWNPTYFDFTILRTHEQFMHGLVKVYSLQMEFYFTDVYGLHTIQDMKVLWEELNCITQTMSDPWLLMGDFNVVLSVEDRVNGTPIQEAKSRDFKNFLQVTGVMEMKVEGRTFAWTNNHVYIRFDRELINPAWVQKWTHLEALVLDLLFSDHSPLSVTLEDRKEQVARPFKFYNYLVDHPEFMAIVETTWSRPNNSIPMVKVWKKLQKLKVESKILNKKEFAGISDRVKKTKEKLQVMFEEENYV
ncbi:uncharacterized protein LOC142166363 [Nicotiana tabacum]|uniref:Uncharacterized protein LOC142166363 n=1 Tax=Nicotiana tabacum TaxID=4097 RepID=A0AC58S993_TOBAC